MTKAVALLSGGLDSTLAVKLMLDQGIEVHALNFTSAFCTCSGSAKKELSGGCRSESMKVARRFGIPIKVMVKGLDYIEIVRNPRYGRGKGINPCVDCRIYMFRRAGEYMAEIGASFIVTGEVLGQRPMSQRRETMKIIERESGLEGLILRPLCARQLEPTIPEKEGLVDRNKLLAITGRTRRPQIELADELEVGDYPCPSGGCLLTDRIFSRKVRDLLDHKEEVTLRDLRALKFGRHFRYRGAKVVVGRDEGENAKLKGLAEGEAILVEPVGFAGPVALIMDAPAGALSNGLRDFAAGLVVRYSAGKAGEGAKVKFTADPEEIGEAADFTVTAPLAEEVIEGARVC
ncbi:MAG TPA: hypothetical protein ENJ37_08190 [Deltaproteobacteria bacterium]|nr:hypothetical protein [Deltaproteobacteria bacterium]